MFDRSRHSIRSAGARFFALFAALLAVLATAAPAGALVPQPVDASDQGALAFVCFAIMCGLIAASLFYMDRVRRRRFPDD
ncbi:MAG TPA: hypothetical protein VH914_00240 [Acidimicrobiia bacterium]|nr:hypothetical protein [Acidimicrobiia bacterium]